MITTYEIKVSRNKDSAYDIVFYTRKGTVALELCGLSSQSWHVHTFNKGIPPTKQLHIVNMHGASVRFAVDVIVYELPDISIFMEYSLDLSKLTEDIALQTGIKLETLEIKRKRGN